MSVLAGVALVRWQNLPKHTGQAMRRAFLFFDGGLGGVQRASHALGDRPFGHRRARGCHSHARCPAGVQCGGRRVDVCALRGVGGGGAVARLALTFALVVLSTVRVRPGHRGASGVFFAPRGGHHDVQHGLVRGVVLRVRSVQWGRGGSGPRRAGGRRRPRVGAIVVRVPRVGGGGRKGGRKGGRTRRRRRTTTRA